MNTPLGRRLRSLAAAALLGPGLACQAGAQDVPGCRFSWFHRATGIDLGTLDPTRPGAIGLIRSLVLTGACAHGSQAEILGGPARHLRGPGGEQLPYQVRLQQRPLGGKHTALRLELDIAYGSYANLPAGPYVDSFTITLLP
jgi:hypothetical protein